MSESYTRDFKKIMRDAAQEAHAHNHTVITPEHMLFAMTDDPIISKTFERMDVHIKDIRTAINAHFYNINDVDPGSIALPTEKSRELKTILDSADEIAGNPDGITAITALMALMLFEKQCKAKSILKDLGVTPEDIAKHRADMHENARYLYDQMEHGNDEGYDTSWTKPAMMSIPRRKTKEKADKSESYSALHQFCNDLNADAAHTGRSPVIGREKEMKMCVRTLMRKKKPNALLIGDEGVGKTAIAEGLAYAIEHNDPSIPDDLKSSRIYSLDLAALMAGTKWRGDLEKRVKALVDDLKRHPDAILFIDEVHNFVSGPSDGDLANLLKPILSTGNIRVIAATTIEENRKKLSKDPAFKRRFQEIIVDEPDVEKTLKIVTQSISTYEEHHNVKFTPAALKDAVYLGARYVHSSHMPDRIFDILDLTAAEARIAQGKKKSSRPISVSADAVRTMISEMSGIPVTKLDSSGLKALRNLEKNLNANVIGQVDATRILSAAIKRNRLGLSAENRPQGSFLFQGQTGTGKTALCQEIATEFGMDFIRFNMSEYMEPHTVSRLIGAPPGYVGFDNGGLLTEAVNKKPYSVLLLDEIEKAHPDIFNVLLQIMDDGSLTDTNGKKANFRNVILIMTTNAGASIASKSQMGFVADQKHADNTITEAVKRVFSPEFRNRLDAIVPFKSLEHETLLGIAKKFIAQLQTRLKREHDIDLKWSPQTHDYICKNGTEPGMNARPLERAVIKLLTDPIMTAITDEKLKKSGTVKIDFNKNAADKDTAPVIKFLPPPPKTRARHLQAA